MANILSSANFGKSGMSSVKPMGGMNVTPVMRPMGGLNINVGAPRTPTMNINTGAPKLNTTNSTPVQPRMGTKNVTPISNMQLGAVNKSSPVSNELSFDVHRGLKQSPIKGAGLGMHWSVDEGVARQFSGGGKKYTPNTWSPSDSSQPHTVVHAKVPISSVETDRKVLGQRGVFDPSSPSAQFRGIAANEKEVSVKPGAPVMVTGVTKYRRIERPSQSPYAIPGFSKEVTTKPRTRTYNPPRQMKG